MLNVEKLNIELPYDSAIPFLGTYPEELKAGLKQIIVHHVHSSIIPIANRQKQPKQQMNG